MLLNPISPPMQLAWDAAVAAFKEFIKAIKNGELIANGVHQATGVRQDLDPTEWTREGLILDVRNGDLFERRRALMAAWDRYCNGEMAVDVIELRG